VSVAEDGAATIDVLANDSDPDGDTLSLASVGPSPGGTVTQDGNQVRFTPGADFNGVAFFSYRIVDPTGDSDSATVQVTVTEVNDAPSFTPGPSQSTPEDSGPQTVAGWATDISVGPSNEWGQALTFEVSTTNVPLFASGGEPAIAPDGTLTYTPAANASGTATVTVRAVDDGGTANGGSDTSAPQQFSIVVGDVGDQPIAADDNASTAEDSPGVAFDVLDNDLDPDPGDTLSIASYDASTIASGTLTFDGGGSFTYVPDPDFAGAETFTYTVQDGGGLTDSGTVTITVTPLPDPPVAVADAYATDQDIALLEPAPGLLANDSDVDDDALTVQPAPVAGPSNGSVVLAADGSFTYTPAAGFVGTDTFTYRIDDGTGSTDDGVVTITVGPTSFSVLYLRGSGPSSEVWDLTLAMPPAAFPVPDYDADLLPGLTIEKSDGKETITDPAKRQEWVYVPSSPLVLNGPVRLGLWSTIEAFALSKEGRLYAYLYDCAAGGSACVKLAETDVRIKDWNGLIPDWVYHEFTVGSVNTTIGVGRELRIRLLFNSHNLWVAMTAGYPSALMLTTP
jgi:hypothetical protein